MFNWSSFYYLGNYSVQLNEDNLYDWSIKIMRYVYYNMIVLNMIIYAYDDGVKCVYDRTIP